tara:strand:- start:785 stop:1681 length:897 start_codon:yes stop_codon:yes gene_type:complete
MKKNNSSKDKVSIVIVTFKSEHIIEKCLDNIGPDYDVILVENSNNIVFTSNLQKKYANLNCINIGYDSGFAYALNRGIEKSQSEYIISLNPDSFPEKDCFEKLIKTADTYNDVAVVTPVTYLKNNTKEFNAYGYFNKRKLPIRNSQNKLQVDWVNGNVSLIKKDIFIEIGKFDENFFLEYEERDFQKRIFKAKKKIMIDFDAKSQHLEGQSANEKYAFEMKCEASWHHAWSKHYYYKKHYGLIYSLYLNIPMAFINFLKTIIFHFLRDKKKSKIYKLFFLGFFHSLLNRKSFYRAEIE